MVVVSGANSRPAGDSERYPEEEGWYTIDVGGRTVAVNTSYMEEKEQAFLQLAVYADIMEELFERWLPQAMELSLEALAFQYSLPVREVSVDNNLSISVLTLFLQAAA